MATANSAQREPSMEEILASIRRIIEDSDTGRKQPDDAPESRQTFESEASQDVNADATPEVDAFRAELRAESDVARPITLAEVQARLEAEQGGVEMNPGAESTRADDISDIVTVASTEDFSAAADNAQENGAAEWSAVAGSEDFGKGAEVIAADLKPHLYAEPEKPVASETEGEETTVGDELETQSRPALVSEQTSRQVAAAFGELSEAFASRSRKTFDEMAEKMLRSMLQDWLDNNLPTLVERLVREEIERVARGV